MVSGTQWRTEGCESEVIPVNTNGPKSLTSSLSWLDTISFFLLLPNAVHLSFRSKRLVA